MSKGQSISINTIIIAALALAVLVVLFAIFTGRISLLPKGIEETDTCVQRCTSLNKEVGSIPTEFKKSCDAGEQYVAGAYKDGKYGCCCREKP